MEPSETPASGAGPADRASARDADDVFRELARVRVAYEEETDPVERVRLRERLDELRAEAARVGGGALATVGTDRLVAEIENLRQRLTAIDRAILSPLAIQGSGGQGDGIGIDPYTWRKLNEGIETGMGRAELEARLVACERELTRRQAAGA